MFNDYHDALERKRLAFAALSRTHAEVHDGTGLTFDALWSFFHETNFLYAQKRAALDMERVRATFSPLLSEPNHLLSSLLIRKGERIEAHVSAARAYRETVIVQHLAARFAGKHEVGYGTRMTLAMVDFLDQLPDVSWDKLWYRPANRWPDRAFGDFVRSVGDPERAYLERLTVMMAEPSACTAMSRHVRRAGAADATWIDAMFRDALHMRPAQRDVEDISFAELTLDSILDAYARLGLERRREAWVVDRPGSRGVALLEITSPGLNLSELTNTVRFYGDLAPGDRRALATCARQRYTQLGHTHCIALATAAERAPLEACGFRPVREYICAVWHASLRALLHRHLRKT